MMMAGAAEPATWSGFLSMMPMMKARSAERSQRYVDYDDHNENTGLTTLFQLTRRGDTLHPGSN